MVYKLYIDKVVYKKDGLPHNNKVLLNYVCCAMLSCFAMSDSL